MSRPLGITRPAALLALALSAAFAACSDPFALPPATQAVIERSLTLWALTGTGLTQPSAYDMVGDSTMRTDRGFFFDFALDMRTDSAGDTVAVLLPPGALGLPRDGGLQITRMAYDSIDIAPDGGYQQAAAQPLAVGTVILASSRSQSCNFGYIRPLYAKLEVTAIDKVARSVTFQMALDPNCGYRSLRHSVFPPSE